VIADIEDWPRVLATIRDAQGTIFLGEALRSGHCWQRSDGKGLLASKFRARQRISTLHGRPVHPDAQEAFDSLSQPRIDALGAAVHTGIALEDAIDLRARFITFRVFADQQFGHVYPQFGYFTQHVSIVRLNCSRLVPKYGF
jgi:hypothetical protein